MQKIKYYKQDERVKVYQYLNNPESIFKKYLMDYNFINSKKDLEKLRERLLMIKNHEQWPDFVVKPKEVGEIRRNSFIAEFPFIHGVKLDKYLENNKIDLLTCAKFIKSIEDKVMSYEDLVFLDLANTSNIMITPSEGELQFKMINPDDIQFDSYNGFRTPTSILGERTLGLNKCFDDDNRPNKQMDIRSIYSLLYIILNGYDLFYPIFCEKERDEYLKVLSSINVPQGSKLYYNSLLTLYDDEPSELISDSLFELIDDGYDLEVYDKNFMGNQYKLVRK